MGRAQQPAEQGNEPTAPPSPPGPGVKVVPTQPGQIGQPGQPDKRIFGVLPNYRTAKTSTEYVPLTSKQKLYIGYKDSTDYPILLLSGVLAGLNQLTDNNPSFGQGMEGYGKRFSGELADQAIGNMMTESFFPALLHEDPRYFQLGSGPKKHRLFYAMGRIVVTKTDSGGSRFNFSEFGGNAVATGLSNFYYKDSREATDNVQKLGTQIGTDMISNVLKEFWPDVKRRYFSKHSQ